MGNDQSKLKGLKILDSIETNDFWTLYSAETQSDSDEKQILSIFKDESVIPGQLWITQSPLLRAIKNLMIFRHPFILKYITSWDHGSYKYLAVEKVQPLALVLQLQSDIQICLGLRNILGALIFLTENAKARHLNICASSIYVNHSGEWRLGGFEYVWKSKELTKNILDLVKTHRYKPAIDQNESKSNNGDGLEQYAFGVLCEEILKNSKNSDTPYVTEFRDYCSVHVKHANVMMRPKLSAILLHPYFNHEFIQIHSFLTELPLKNPSEKQDFFTGLIDRLHYFDENVVAAQVGGLLLSRMVLLDTTAQLCVTPYILKTKNDISMALFSPATFTKYIIPQIKKVFHVRDAQIRLILLEHFNEYVKLLTKEDLQEQILPNLLLGIKDTNDLLVAKTLRCLADLVPILGSAIVIGGNRGRLFADGRPQGLPDTKSNWIEGPRSITPVLMKNTANGEYLSDSPLPDHVDLSESINSIAENSIGNLEKNPSSLNNAIMLERLSPDGGEDSHITPADATDGEDDDVWSDWENNDARTIETIRKPHTYSNTTKTINDDINDFDIKIQKINSKQTETEEEIDFFKDMEPVIKSSPNDLSILPVELSNNKIENSHETVTVDKSRFEFKMLEELDVNEAGWGDDEDNDWG